MSQVVEAESLVQARERSFGFCSGQPAQRLVSVSVNDLSHRQATEIDRTLLDEWSDERDGHEPAHL